MASLAARGRLGMQSVMDKRLNISGEDVAAVTSQAALEVGDVTDELFRSKHIGGN